MGLLKRSITFTALLLFIFVAYASVACAQEAVTIDGRDGGRTFQGVGAVSAGASSRLLFDYPEPARSEILDYLFKPGYGASIQILKVEIGGDMNSTDGSEPSHMRTPTDLGCSRGYEWWLMKEAKQRNPDIKLAGLQWGAPGWFDGGFWSQDNIDYLLAWLGCAEQHGLKIDYVGGWNERGFEPAWYVAFDEALEAAYPGVKIVAADDLPHHGWRVVAAMEDNPAFSAVVDVVGVHSPCSWRTPYEHCPSPPEARGLGKPLWNSEHSTQGHNAGAAPLARAMNRLYIDGRMTGNLAWSLVSAWYANLPIADTGLLLAEWPWSGYYDVGKSIWVYAHTAQFAHPGWQYIDSASGYLDSGASYVTLKSPHGRDYSTIIETMDATAPSKVQFTVIGGLSSGPVHLWSTDLRSSDSRDYFVHQRTIRPEGGVFMVTLRPGHLYSLSTTTGQAKGTAKPPSGPAEQMSLPYQEDFERYDDGELARYFSDLNGGFQTAPCGGGREGTCYRQMVNLQPIIWNAAGKMPPTTIMGDPRWWGDYEVSTDVLLEQPGYVELIARIAAQRGLNVAGYHLRVSSDGTWWLYSEDLKGDDVDIASGVVPFEVGEWHNLALRMRGDRIAVFINGEVEARVRDTRQRTGQIALRVSPWQSAQFDNVKIVPTGPWPQFVPHEQMTASTTSTYVSERRGYISYAAGKAIDDRPETFWHSDVRAPLPETITLDLGDSYKVQALTYQPRLGLTKGMITRYNIYLSSDGRTFEKVASGEWPISASTKTAMWPAQQARYVRLEAVEASHGFAAAGEINISTTQLTGNAEGENE